MEFVFGILGGDIDIVYASQIILATQNYLEFTRCLLSLTLVRACVDGIQMSVMVVSFSVSVG